MHWLNTGVKILAKGQKNVAKTREIIYEGIANCNGLKSGSQIINYDI